MERLRTPSDRQVYRPVLSRVLLAVFAAVGVWWAVDLAVHGRIGAALLLALWATAAVAALGCLFWRPAVIVDDTAVELRNVVRDVRVPWDALEDVTTRYALTLHTGGRRHQSWAGPAPGRTARARRQPDERWIPGGADPRTSSRDLNADSGAAAFLVEQRWRSWRDRRGSAPPPTPGAPAEQREPAQQPGGPAAEVRWRPVLPGIAVGAAALATVLTPVLR